MTITRYRLCVVVFAAGLVSNPALALTQTSAAGARPRQQPWRSGCAGGGLAAKVTSLDGHIARLVADMKMFTGELKYPGDDPSCSKAGRTADAR